MAYNKNSIVQSPFVNGVISRFLSRRTNMQNIFFILGKELTFSDERVNYVKLKREYDKKIPEAKSTFSKIK